MTRRIIFPLVTIGLALAICAAFVDRPLALWLDAQFKGTATFAAAAAIFRPVDGVFIAGFLLLAVSFIARRLFRAPVPPLPIISGATAMTAAVVAGVALKIAVGRSQVVPGFLDQHIYGLRPFALSETYMGFPSATMAGAAGFLTGLGARSALARAAGAGIFVVLAVALLVTNGHWLSDIIGGTALGVLIGVRIAAMSRRGN